MNTTTTQLEEWLRLLREGDGEARAGLIGRACERLRLLTRRMLRGYPLVRRFEQTDDVFQGAMIRLYRSLADVTPESLRHFFNLAGQQVRRELLDMAKRYTRLDGQAELSRFPTAEPAHEADEPSSLAEWTEFHESVEALPDNEREVFLLLWYSDLTQEEAAEILGVATRTIIRRWQSARVLLSDALRGGPTDHDDA